MRLQRIGCDKMAEIFNITNVTQAGDFNGFVGGANSLVDGGLGVSLLILFFVLIMMSLMLRGFTVNSGFAVSSFITGLVSYFFMSIGLINEFFFMIFLLLPVVGLTLLYFSKRG